MGTYEDLPFIQVYSDAKPMHRSTVLGTTAFCPRQCCSALVLGHCTAVCSANLHMCSCSGTSLLSGCFAEQHLAVRTAFCKWQCCNALLVGHCSPVRSANPHRCNCSGTSLLSGYFYRAALSSGNSILPKAVLQCIVGGSLVTCMNSEPS